MPSEKTQATIIITTATISAAQKTIASITVIFLPPPHFRQRVLDLVERVGADLLSGYARLEPGDCALVQSGQFRRLDLSACLIDQLGHHVLDVHTMHLQCVFAYMVNEKKTKK
jgi:hypothetical protein